MALSGDLGAGKTLITKGIAAGLGVDRPEYVTSPTFTIHNQYRGRLELHHLDFYRLGDDTELAASLRERGLAEVFGGSLAEQSDELESAPWEYDTGERDDKNGYSYGTRW